MRRSWILGSCLAVLAVYSMGLVEAELAPGASSDLIFDFSSASDTSMWSLLTDVVMGGKSRATVEASEPGTIRFTGRISTEGESAGFAQMRSVEFEDGFPGITGWRVRLKGDGKHYMMSINTADSHEGVYYRVSFPTRAGEWEEHEFALADFKPHYRGFWVAHGPIKPGMIRSIGFMIAERQDGPFSLEIDWIRSVTEVPAAGAADSG